MKKQGLKCFSSLFAKAKKRQTVRNFTKKVFACFSDFKPYVYPRVNREVLFIEVSPKCYPAKFDNLKDEKKTE